MLSDDKQSTSHQQLSKACIIKCWKKKKFTKLLQAKVTIKQQWEFSVCLVQNSWQINAEAVFSLVLRWEEKIFKSNMPILAHATAISLCSMMLNMRYHCHEPINTKPANCAAHPITWTCCSEPSFSTHCGWCSFPHILCNWTFKSWIIFTFKSRNHFAAPYQHGKPIWQ